MNADQYYAILIQLYKEGIHTADGIELELCFDGGDQMKLSLVFDDMNTF